MKIPNKKNLKQFPLNHSSDIDSQGFMNLDKKCTVKPNSFLATDNTLASDKSSHFRTNLLEVI